MYSVCLFENPERISVFISLSLSLIGSSSWIDFTNPEIRKWWSGKFALSEYQVPGLLLGFFLGVLGVNYSILHEGRVFYFWRGGGREGGGVLFRFENERNTQSSRSFWESFGGSIVRGPPSPCRCTGSHIHTFDPDSSSSWSKVTSALKTLESTWNWFLVLWSPWVFTEQDLKISTLINALTFRVVSANVHANSISSPISLLSRACMLSHKYVTHVMIFPWIFKLGSWKVLEKSLNFWPEKVYEPWGFNQSYE